MIPSIPHINKQSFESPGAEDSAGSKVFDFTDIINNCIYFNNGKALLVSSYVIQTTLIDDGIFILLAILQPNLSGLV